MNQIIRKPSEINQFFQENGGAPLKKLGQNFFINEALLRNLVQEIREPSIQRILEIGPGFGMLTQLIAMRYGRCRPEVFLLEKDTMLCKYLQQTIPVAIHDVPMQIVCGDFLKPPQEFLDVIDFWKKEQRERSNQNLPAFHYLLAGNLPYHISSDVLLWMLEQNLFSSGFFVLQDEFVEKLVRPGNRLNHWVLAHGSVTILKKIDKNNFFPVPGVDSRAFLYQRDQSRIDVFLQKNGYAISTNQFFKALEKILKILFWANRKTVQSILKTNPHQPYDVNVIQRWHEVFAIDFQKRPEELEAEEVWQLAIGSLLFLK